MAGPDPSLPASRWVPGTPPRYCPHCAAPLAERLAFGRRRLACAACGFVHLRDPKVGVSALVEVDGRLLLVRRGVEPELGKWCLPSGFVEWDESPEEALRRECEEETGLALADLRLLDAAHYTDDPRGPGINLVYRASAAGGRLQPGDDAQAAVLFAPDELPAPDEIAFPGHRRAVEAWARGFEIRT